MMLRGVVFLRKIIGKGETLHFLFFFFFFLQTLAIPFYV